MKKKDKLQPFPTTIRAMDNGENKVNSKSPSNQLMEQVDSQPILSKKSVNEDSNKAQGRIKSEIRDATGGNQKEIKDLLKEAPERKNMSAVEKYTGRKPMEKTDVKDLHLKSTTSLTDPETAKQNLKRPTQPTGKLPSNELFRGGGGRGGTPTIIEPDEILKKKDGVINPEEIISKKGKAENFIIAMNSEKKPVVLNPDTHKVPEQFKESSTKQHKNAQQLFQQKQNIQEKQQKEPITKSVSIPKLISKSETIKTDKPSKPQISSKVKR